MEQKSLWDLKIVQVLQEGLKLVFENAMEMKGLLILCVMFA